LTHHTHITQEHPHFILTQGAQEYCNTKANSLQAEAMELLAIQQRNQVSRMLLLTAIHSLFLARPLVSIVTRWANLIAGRAG